MSGETPIRERNKRWRKPRLGKEQWKERPEERKKEERRRKNRHKERNAEEGQS